jgi:ElaB/YqjD/DUF883 family membrane-anchored ribosome-binding protein
MTYQEQQDAIKNKMSGTANDVADRASGVMESAKNQGAAAKKEVYRTASDIANRASDALNDAGIDTDSLSRALSTSMDSISKSVRAMVRDRPLGALAITAAIGLIIGAMSSR